MIPVAGIVASLDEAVPVVALTVDDLDATIDKPISAFSASTIA